MGAAFFEEMFQRHGSAQLIGLALRQFWFNCGGSFGRSCEVVASAAFFWQMFNFNARVHAS
jgi:hypothetical protein